MPPTPRDALALPKKSFCPISYHTRDLSLLGYSDTPGCAPGGSCNINIGPAAGSQENCWKLEIAGKYVERSPGRVDGARIARPRARTQLRCRPRFSGFGFVSNPFKLSGISLKPKKPDWKVFTQIYKFYL